MTNIFKKLFKMAKKQETDQQLTDAIAVAQRLGAENRELKRINEALIEDNAKMTEELNGAIERVRYLAGQVSMLEAQNKAKTQFSDSDRNY